MTEGFEACGHIALPRFRKLSSGMLTACCKEKGHAGNHVYCMRVNAGIDHNAHALHFLEEISRGELKPVVIVEMENPMTTEEEAAVIWQFLEYQREEQTT